MIFARLTLFFIRTDSDYLRFDFILFQSNFRILSSRTLSSLFLVRIAQQSTPIDKLHVTDKNYLFRFNSFYQK
jgi:hypothetical protein